MNKFKPGDIVVCIKKHFNNETVGKTYKVGPDYHKNNKDWFFVEADDNGNVNSFYPTHFELCLKYLKNKEFKNKLDLLIEE